VGRTFPDTVGPARDQADLALHRRHHRFFPILRLQRLSLPGAEVFCICVS
jgi:hypothetical protein